MMKSRTIQSLIVLFLAVVAINQSLLAQVPERILFHPVEANLTYVSCATDSSGNLYTATSFADPYTYEGQSITLMLENSSEEVLVCAHTNDGDLLWFKRMAVTGGNFTSVGRIEFMAADQDGYTYLSTQGTTGSGFLRVENDSLPIGSGNLMIQLNPQGELKSVSSHLGIRNVVARDSLIYVAMSDATDANKFKVKCYDSTFVEPIWTNIGSSNFTIGANANDRSHMSISPNGNLIAVLAMEGPAGTFTFENEQFTPQTSNGFDENIVVIMNREGDFLGYRSFYGSEFTGGLTEIANSLTISDQGHVTIGCFTPNPTTFAGSEFDSAPGFLSNYGLIVSWDEAGNELWAVQILSVSTTPRIDGLAVRENGDVLFAGNWQGQLNINGELLETGNSLRSVTGRLNGVTGELLWYMVPETASNSIHGQRLVTLDDDRYVMCGKSVQSYSFACLSPVTTTGKSQFFLFIDESIQADIQANFEYNTDAGTIELTNLTEGGSDFSWSFGDGGESEEESPTYTYLENGTYTVTLTASNCLGSSTVSQDVEIIIIGLEEVDGQALSFGQSVDGRTLFLRTEIGNGGYTIHDSNGRVCTSGVWQAGTNQIDVSGLASGAYYFTVDHDGVSKSFQFLRY